MKQRTKVILVLLFPLLSQIAISCCNCDDPIINHYTNRRLEVSNLDNSEQDPVVSNSGEIIKTAYGIRVRLTREEIACNRNRKNFSLFSSAYAFSCDCPEPVRYLPRDSILAIHIYTVNNFDDQHPANSAITTYFKKYEKYLYTSIPNYVADYGHTLYSPTEFVATLDFMLLTPPTIGLNHKFRIQFVLSDTRTLEIETTEINLI